VLVIRVEGKAVGTRLVQCRTDIRTGSGHIPCGRPGWHLGEKLHWRKFTLWEEAGRVPLIFVAPGVTKPNTQCERTVSLLDIYPTMADLAGLPVGEHLEGKSLRPLLADPVTAWDRPVLTTHGRNNHHHNHLTSSTTHCRAV